MKLQYLTIGIIDEDKQGIWEAICGCSGYIDENYNAIITKPCSNHKTIKWVKPQ